MFGKNVKTQIEDTSKINQMVDSANKKLAPNTAPGYNKMQKAFLFKKLNKCGHSIGGFRGGYRSSNRGRGHGHGQNVFYNGNNNNSPGGNRGRGQGKPQTK